MPRRQAMPSGRAVYARRKGLLEQAKKVTTGVRSHKREREGGQLQVLQTSAAHSKGEPCAG